MIDWILLSLQAAEVQSTCHYFKITLKFSWISNPKSQKESQSFNESKLLIAVHKDTRTVIEFRNEFFTITVIGS